MCYSPIIQSGGKFSLKFSAVRYVSCVTLFFQFYLRDEYNNSVHCVLAYMKEGAFLQEFMTTNKLHNLRWVSFLIVGCHNSDYYMNL